VVNWDLIQIVMSYQGYPQPWHGEDLIRVASACHKRNLFRGSRGYPVGFTRHLFGNAPIAPTVMTDRGCGRGLLRRALCPTPAASLCWRGATPRRLNEQLGINCVAPTSNVYSVTCARFCGTSCDVVGPVADPGGRSTSSCRHVYLL